MIVHRSICSIQRIYAQPFRTPSQMIQEPATSLLDCMYSIAISFQTHFDNKPLDLNRRLNSIGLSMGPPISSWMTWCCSIRVALVPKTHSGLFWMHLISLKRPKKQLQEVEMMVCSAGKSYYFLKTFSCVFLKMMTSHLHIVEDFLGIS